MPFRVIMCGGMISALSSTMVTACSCGYALAHSLSILIECTSVYAKTRDHFGNFSCNISSQVMDPSTPLDTTLRTLLRSVMTILLEIVRLEAPYRRLFVARVRFESVVSGTETRSSGTYSSGNARSLDNCRNSGTASACNV